jgi:hypothetical protein
LITLADATSALLLATADPAGLFVIKRIELLNWPARDRRSRNATAGRANAEASPARSPAGLTIVSGLRWDHTAAHKGALDADGDASTIAVVGTGVDVIYSGATAR